MLSRVADRIYWTGRYIERAENTARLVTVNTNLLLDLPRRTTLGWRPLIDITGSKRRFSRLFRNATEKNVVRFLIADTRNPGSLVNCLQCGRENARTIRDVIPREGWEAVNALYWDIKAALPSGIAQKNRHEFLNAVIAGTQRTTGLFAGTMLHDHGYSFLRMGRNLERADMTTRIIDVRSDTLLPEESEETVPLENIQWMSVLQSLSAYQGYRQKVQGPVRRRDALWFLFYDTQFPRAIYHCLLEVRDCLERLPRSKTPLSALKDLIKQLDNTDLEKLTRAKLSQFIDHLQRRLAELHHDISTTYFELENAAD